MTRLADKLTPDVTTLIRLDHSHVLATFRQYRPDSEPRVRQGLVSGACLALEIHTQLEEEIFTPRCATSATAPFLHAPSPSMTKCAG